jgi:hypothetical protein
MTKSPERAPGGLDRGTLLIRVALCSAVVLPPVLGALAWLIASLLISMEWSAAVGILFLVQSAVLCFVLNAFCLYGGSRNQGDRAGPPAQPVLFGLKVFCGFALCIIAFSLPLALVVTVAGLLA